jgi:hypothetical protein
MTDDPKDHSESGHTFPPDAFPPAELARYSPSRDPDRERDIAGYIEVEAPDETVQHVELIKTEIVAGQKYDVWDVTTDKERWWVIENPTNLYSQKHFASLDFALSFHIGLMMRVAARRTGAEASDPSPFDEVLRRQEQAGGMLDRAVEAHDFQAVASQLREGLLSLLPAMRRRVSIPAGSESIKEGDFIGWYGVLMDTLCPGNSNKELRQYLKHTAKDSWQLVSWLVHDRDANKTATIIALHAFSVVVGHSVQILERTATDFTESCPVCKSRNVRMHFDPFLGDDGEYYSTCGSCGWSTYPESESTE